MRFGGDQPYEPDLLTDRRQRAREAFYDGMATGDVVESQALEAAIETATRVRVTPEIVRAARVGYMGQLGSDWVSDPGPRETARLTAAFRAAGFEIEE